MSNEKEVEVTSIPEKNQFDFWYNAKEEMMTKIKKPFRKSALKRGFASAYDSWSEQIIALEEMIIDTRKNLITCSDLSSEGAKMLNSLVGINREIAKLKGYIEGLKSEYVTVFGKEMKVDNED